MVMVGMIIAGKSKTQEFREKLKKAIIDIGRGSIWRHYKGGVYMVDDFAIDTDDTSVRVLYHRIDGPDYGMSESDIRFARPLEEWFDKVEVPERDVQFEETDMVEKSRFIRVHQEKVWVEDT
jgi:hypothetical protein